MPEVTGQEQQIKYMYFLGIMGWSYYRVLAEWLVLDETKLSRNHKWNGCAAIKQFQLSLFAFKLCEDLLCAFG